MVSQANHCIVSPQKIILKRKLAHGRPRGCRWFSDKKKLQAHITIALKPKRKEKARPKP